MKYALGIYQAAQKLCQEYSLWSERAVGLMFDIRVQIGGINSICKAQILSDFASLAQQELSPEDLEIGKMKAVATRSAQYVNPKWAADVLNRKLCCALGEGQVHGVSYNLETQFGLRLVKVSH
jgi:hypothetical protein